MIMSLNPLPCLKNCDSVSPWLPPLLCSGMWEKDSVKKKRFGQLDLNCKINPYSSTPPNQVLSTLGEVKLANKIHCNVYIISNNYPMKPPGFYASVVGNYTDGLYVCLFPGTSSQIVIISLHQPYASSSLIVNPIILVRILPLLALWITRPM